MSQKTGVFTFQRGRFAGNDILRQEFFYLVNIAVPDLRTQADAFVLSGGNTGCYFTAEGVFKFGESEAQVVKRAGD